MLNNVKQQAVNTFTGGLNTDLHPLTTPNDILTDCVNGTIVTYNGNEYILQNDMGNYQLKKATLTPNYIPIGIKEYAGIIYIVSYNPIEKLTEIGSYPSPKTIEDSETDSGKEARYIILESGYNNYTTLSKKQSIELYSSGEDFMLNPGDKYYLYLNLGDNYKDLLYQTIEFYVLSEEKNLFPVKINNIHTSEPSDRNYDNVDWEIPGWLAYKFKIATIDQFELYITKLNQPNFIDNTINLDYSVMAQAITSDTLFTKELQNKEKLSDKLKVWIAVGYLEDSGVKKYISNIDGELKELENNSILDESVGIIVNLSESIKYTTINQFLYTKNIDPSLESYKNLNIPITSNTKTIFIEAIPLIQDAEPGKHIIYDNFKTTTIVNLNDIASSDDITVFETYKYLVSSDDITLNYNISGIFSNYGLTSELRIYKITNNNDDKDYDLKLAYAQKLNDSNYLGQNIVTCNFQKTIAESPKISDLEPIETLFEKEEIYLLQLRIYFDETGKQFKNWHRLLITSELMNPFYNTIKDFSTIKLSDWIGQLTNYIELPDVKLDVIPGKLELYRNSGSDSKYYNKDKWIYQLSKETNGKAWQQEYSVDVKDDYMLNSEDFPAVGVISTNKVEITNYDVNVFNNDGIWSNIDWDFDFNAKTSKNSLIEFNKENTSADIDLYERYSIPLVSQLTTENIFDRSYMYDYSSATIRSDRTKKFLEKHDYEQIYVYIRHYYDSKFYIYLSRGEVDTNLNPPKLQVVDASKDHHDYYVNNGDITGWYDNFVNYHGTFIPYLFHSLYSTGWWKMPKQNDFKKHELFGIRFPIIKEGTNSMWCWCFVPFDDGTFALNDEYRGPLIERQLLEIANQFSVHVYANTNFKSNKYNLLIPNYIITSKNLSETITTGNYIWKLNNIKWNNKSIINNTVNEDTLKLKGEKIINDSEKILFNNLHSENIFVEKSKFKNINLTISTDLTSDFTFNDDENVTITTNIASIKIDIDNFLVNLKELSIKRKEESTNSLNVTPYSVSHDLRELNIDISDNVLRSYDDFVSHLSVKKSSNEPEFVKFYSTYTAEADVFKGSRYEKHNTNLFDNGYYLSIASKFRLPVHDERLWDNVSENFKDKT